MNHILEENKDKIVTVGVLTEILDVRFNEFAVMVANGFADVIERIGGVRKTADILDTKFVSLDTKFSSLERKFVSLEAKMDDKFEELHRRFDSLERRLVSLEVRHDGFEKYTHSRFAATEKRFDLLEKQNENLQKGFDFLRGRVDISGGKKLAAAVQ